VNGATFRSGATAWPWIHHMKKKEKRIQTLFDHFNTGGMTLNKYIAAIKHITGLDRTILPKYFIVL